LNEKNKNLITRIITALIVLPVVLVLFARGGWFSAIMLAVVAALCAGEYYVIVFKKLSAGAIVGCATAALLPLLPVWGSQKAGEWSFWIITFFFIFAWAYHLIKGPIAQAPTLSAHLMSGLLYGALGLTALSALRLKWNGGSWVVAALTVTWANDTLAYFAGRFFGKHKLYPAVSPNKTWEGFAGGMVGSILGLVIFKQFFFSGLSWADCVCVGVAGGVLGPLGDFCESMLKRAYGVKDSGRLVPGHGGILDRIDALLFNAPMVFVYVEFIRPHI
jgi:phosphatidate cytidylyltransferase